MRKNISNSEKTSESNPLSINRVVKPKMVIERKIINPTLQEVWNHTIEKNNNS
ncbi:UPF0042 nucleotide-binding protein [Chryseobacterium sp. StRB126]|uniref:hypothetical protein n=1 Tax=Chryseobacterium sp. StRB126 TaxID=878220 RepID=UPI0004E9987C|nr:hypothetical protein [Chryseobacterium sp. StRB126]BAP33405.1 UPF0042 nucleotide-binding protein [Chryseobacterium sp. StRB126]